LSTRCLHIVYTLSTRCLQVVYHCHIYNVSTMYLQCVYNVSTSCQQFVFNKYCTHWRDGIPLIFGTRTLVQGHWHTGHCYKDIGISVLRSGAAHVLRCWLARISPASVRQVVCNLSALLANMLSTTCRH
jgi:hypothetical protein